MSTEDPLETWQSLNRFLFRLQSNSISTNTSQAKRCSNLCCWRTQPRSWYQLFRFSFWSDLFCLTLNGGRIWEQWDSIWLFSGTYDRGGYENEKVWYTEIDLRQIFQDVMQVVRNLLWELLRIYLNKTFQLRNISRIKKSDEKLA